MQVKWQLKQLCVNDLFRLYLCKWYFRQSGHFFRLLIFKMFLTVLFIKEKSILFYTCKKMSFHHYAIH